MLISAHFMNSHLLRLCGLISSRKDLPQQGWDWGEQTWLLCEMRWLWNQGGLSFTVSEELCLMKSVCMKIIEILRGQYYSDSCSCQEHSVEMPAKFPQSLSFSWQVVDKRTPHCKGVFFVVAVVLVVYKWSLWRDHENETWSMNMCGKTLTLVSRVIMMHVPRLHMSCCCTDNSMWNIDVCEVDREPKCCEEGREPTVETCLQNQGRFYLSKEFSWNPGTWRRAWL